MLHVILVSRSHIYPADRGGRQHCIKWCPHPSPKNSPPGDFASGSNKFNFERLVRSKAFKVDVKLPSHRNFSRTHLNGPTNSSASSFGCCTGLIKLFLPMRLENSAQVNYTPMQLTIVSDCGCFGH